MRVLSVVHGPEARAELFEPVVVAAGHAIDEWSFSWGRKPPRPLESYDAYMVFGGAIHPDQEAQHTWIPEEIDWLERILADRRPVLGVCLGVQLLARAAGSQVRRLDVSQSSATSACTRCAVSGFVIVIFKFPSFWLS